jgi:hypothetical protein
MLGSTPKANRLAADWTKLRVLVTPRIVSAFRTGHCDRATLVSPNRETRNAWHESNTALFRAKSLVRLVEGDSQ